ncbi:MAG: calcium/sodium antiporter [Phycisphaerae bacterium]
MQWPILVVYLIVGLAILKIAGDWLVGGASQLAQRFGISPLVVGLTVVAFGTSAPEVAVSILAAIKGEFDIAIGNVIGSNTANLLLILGFSALLARLNVALNLARVDAPVMLVVTLALLAAGKTAGVIERWEGIAFIVALFLYIAMTYWLSRKESRVVEEEFEESIKPNTRSAGLLLFMIAVGVAGLAGGAQLIVIGASGLAEMLGVSKAVVGVTVVAIGTSLPELAAAVAAVRQRQPDIAVGNVVGSNIFNVLSVIGIAATIRPLYFNPAFLAFDGRIMLGATLLVMPMLLTRVVMRWQGALMLMLYIGYLVWTTLRVTSSAT